MEFESIQTQRFLKSDHVTELFGERFCPPHDGWYEITKYADNTVTLVELLLDLDLATDEQLHAELEKRRT